MRHLREQNFPGLGKLPGFLGATILRREQSKGVEFVIVTHWTSAEAIRAFSAGDDAEKAVVPPEVREMMLEYDIHARHYLVID